jgi:phenylacetyl-CoA:acceptor oxidoreductase subunit 1
MVRWAMVIDVRKCVGCGVCESVCEQMNKTPPGAGWRRLVHCDIDRNSGGRRLFFATNCMHCNEPPCLKACPTTATYLRADGIVDIAYELCVGCGSCVVSCPYQARRITYYDKVIIEREVRPGEVTETVPDRIGVCTKCDFCLTRLTKGLAQGLQPGVDPQATPLCVHFCTAEALHFGNLDDPGSEISRLARENNIVCLQQELGTSPSIYYILHNDESGDVT